MAEAASRASFRFSLSVGLIPLDIKAYSMTAEGGIGRKMFVDGDHPVGVVNIDKTTGEIVSSDQIVKKFELPDGRMVEISDDELAEITGGLSGVSAELLRIVPWQSIDEIGEVYPLNHYVVRPGSPAASKPLAVILEALGSSAQALEFRLINRGKENLAYLLGSGQMFFSEWPENVRDEVKAPPTVLVNEAQLDLAVKLLDLLSGEQKPATPVFRQRLIEYATKKADGVVDDQQPVDTAAQVKDLMELLNRSVEKAKS
jgi:DNA end-binding protein Ku